MEARLLRRRRRQERACREQQWLRPRKEHVVRRRGGSQDQRLPRQARQGRELREGRVARQRPQVQVGQMLWISRIRLQMIGAVAEGDTAPTHFLRVPAKAGTRLKYRDTLL